MCKWGTDTLVTLPSGKVIAVDSCIADFVDRLNKAGIETVASCCGHGHLPATIGLTGDRWMIVTDRDTRERFEAMVGRDIHGNAFPPPESKQPLSVTEIEQDGDEILTHLSDGTCAVNRVAPSGN